MSGNAVGIYDELHIISGTAQLIGDGMHLVLSSSHAGGNFLESATWYIQLDGNYDGGFQSITTRAGIDFFSNPEYDFGTIEGIAYEQ